MKLSILITYHEEGPWLLECVESILPELSAHDELLIYDDASELLAEEFAVSDARVRVLRGSNRIGPARARNELLKASTGTHVHFHDADDLFAVNWRAEIAAAFHQGVDVVFTDVQSFDESGKRWPHVMNIARLQKDKDLLKFALRGGLLAPSGAYRREVVERIGGYRADVWQSEDYDFHIRLALAEPAWRAIAHDLVLIRRHAHQRSRQMREVWSGALDALEYSELRIPRQSRTDFARAATRVGSALFAAHAYHDAKRAFRLAGRFGGARYDRPIMQSLTRLGGAMRAERLAALYRKLVPGSLRKRLQRSES